MLRDLRLCCITGQIRYYWSNCVMLSMLVIIPLLVHSWPDWESWGCNCLRRALQRMGLDVDKMILCQPDNGEMALEVVDQLVRSSAVDIIAVDSVAALTPRAEIEGEIGAIQGGPLPPHLLGHSAMVHCPAPDL